MVTLKTFDNLVDAHLLKTKLESEGVPCFLFDENIVALDPLYNMAVGGIKLKVAHKDIANASEILRQIEQAHYTNELNEVILCARCKSKNIGYFRSFRGAKGTLSILSLLLFMVYPIYFRYVYKCKDCGHEFN